MTLSLAVLKLPNFAHAEILTIGAYATVIVAILYPGNVLLAGITAFVLCALIAVAIHYVVFKPLIDRKISIYILMLSSFAVALFLRYSIYSWASIENLLFAKPRIPVYVLGQFFGVNITNVEAIAIPLAIIVSLALGGFLTFTRMGISMRAVAVNFDLARVSGIKINRVVLVMWVIAGGLAGVGGSIFAVYTVATPDMGFNILLEIFTVVIIAGLTSMSGTIVGGYLVGFAENTVMQALYIYFGVPLTYEPILPFAIMVAVLILRPTGISPNFHKLADYFRKSTVLKQEAKL